MSDYTINIQWLKVGFQKVKENHGCAGVDGVTIEKFERNLENNIDNLYREIKGKNYSPLPLLQILVDKGNGEARALCIPTVRDRVAQTAALFLVEPILEREFEECSFAYRKGRSVKQAVNKIKEYYEQGYKWVVDADIDAYFDNVDHGLMMQKVEMYVKDQEIVRLIELWIKAEIWDGKSVEANTMGIPQGSPISPVLANLFLDDLDETMLKNGQRYVRFADDFIVLCKTREKAEKALQLSEKVLENHLLELDEKEIVDFDQGFKFLGVTFIRSMAFVPFDKPKNEKKILYFPQPLNMAAYRLKNRRGW